ncbi:MAG TPA: response regulator transcription factor [Burkholderiales bacterium]|nr:response regulator transcription factor [Burkholderiales bacterium]
MRILLVEDDELLGAGIEDALTRARFVVEWVRTGPLAATALEHDGFDAVVLDLGLPGIDGIDVLRRARAAGNRIPILILSARDAVAQRIAGLNAGADDYLTKPFDVEELIARVRALQRRLHGAAQNVLEHGHLRLDLGAFSVTHEGRAVALQRREFMLLQKLLAAPGQVMTRGQLEESLYGWDGSVESNALDVHVHNLRKKLYPGVIRTVRGIGYVADPPP